MTTEELAAQALIRKEQERLEVLRLVIEKYPDLTAEEQVAKATTYSNYVIG